ncbi:MAG: alpha,alpha-trehalase TreF [Bacteroidota bacterium]
MKNLLFLFIIALSIGCSSEKSFPDNNKNDKYPYPEEVYGSMFGEIQMMRLYPDSKTFADATPKVDVEEIKLEFRKRKNDVDFDAKAFVEEYWDIPEAIASGFKTDTTKTLIEHINSLWPVLTRSSDNAVKGSTLIPLPNPYIVPGGRFREIYYWDSYFTMLGLKESGRDDMIKNMLDNFVFLINEIGHIPNGNRTYFISRSQPPFFAEMVELYAGIKGDQVYKEYLPALQKEYDFWMRGYDKINAENTEYEHCVYLEKDVMINRYFDSHNEPRQESYGEDREMPNQVYGDLRAACESGWDFSSRWLRRGNGLWSIRTLDIFPVDLNTLLYGLEENLEKGYRIAGNSQKADEFKSSRSKRVELMNTYHWSDSLGVFFDYHFKRDFQLEDKYTPAMMFPLYFKMASQEQAAKVVANVTGKLLKPGGIVTSTSDTGQQWDAPNGWAPLQWITLVGMDNYGYKEEALDLAKRWTTLNEKVYKSTGKMLEKYNVEDLSLEAGGGEYPVQDGFGWSNGVYLAMKQYILENE